MAPLAPALAADPFTGVAPFLGSFSAT